MLGDTVRCARACYGEALERYRDARRTESGACARALMGEIRALVALGRAGRGSCRSPISCFARAPNDAEALLPWLSTWRWPRATAERTEPSRCSTTARSLAPDRADVLHADR